jgi:nucleoside-diphosphate-sugar epimerase
MREFRSRQYDVGEAERTSIVPLQGIVDALANSSCQGVVYSGSYFEPGEGGPGAGADALPYARCKAKAWQELKKICDSRAIPASKIVIPNPIGPLENEDRLIPGLIQKARASESMRLMSPRSVSDNLPVRDLARKYVQVAEKLIAGGTGVFRPSGWVCDTQSFVETVSRELLTKRLRIPPIKIECATEANPKMLKNSEPEKIDLDQLWDEYAEWVKRGF